MKKLYIVILILFFSTLISHSQNVDKKENEKVSLRLYPSHYTETSFKNEIQKLIAFNNLRGSYIIDISKNYENLVSKMDSVNVELKSGTNWYLSDGPPKKPSFFIFKFLFNKLDSTEMDRVYYLEMLGYFEKEKKLPVEKISKIIYKQIFFNEQNEKLIVLENEIQLDSLKKFGNLNQEILYIDSVKIE